MSIPYWKCLKCMKEFKPIINEHDISFYCPSCGSPNTVVKRLGVQASGCVCELRGVM